MTMARSQLVNVAVTRWYHCITRCVRRAFLLGEAEGDGSRKDWIEQRLEELANIFAVSVGGFSITDKHRELGHPLQSWRPIRNWASSEPEQLERSP